MDTRFPEILYEDNHLIAVNKRNREPVQPDTSGDTSLEDIVKKYIKEKYHKTGEAFLGVIHRIDRPVSGVVIFARTGKSLERMNKLFQEKNVEKIYWAIVKNPPPSETETLIHYLVRDAAKNMSYVFDKETPGSKKASLTYRVAGKSDNYYFLEIRLHTGRHHQIRCQLAKIGCPVKGDLKYGFPRSDKNGGISLHSRSAAFIHPVRSEPLMIIANPPDEPLWNYFLEICKK